MSKTESFAASLKHKLNVLGCPYTEDLSEDAVTDLVLSVGEGRLQVLQWLMLQYHPKLADILEPSHNSLGWKSDSKLKKILSAASIMCLCDSDDISLIRGDSPIVKQIAFINRLIAVVEVSLSRDTVESVSAMQCNNYVDAMSGHESCNSLMRDASLDLVPKDIWAEVDQRNKDWPQHPDLKELIDQCQTLSQELDKETNALHVASRNYSIPTKDQQNEVANMSQVLSSAVRELSQLASGFSHSFESHIGMWCEKEAPQLNSLGPTFKRVDKALEQFINVLEQVNKIRQLKGELDKNIKEKTTRSLVTAHGSHEASDSFEDCLGILEEATHRLEAGFRSMYKPLLTL